MVWCYRGGGVPKEAFARKHDIILFYAGKGATFNTQYIPYSDATAKLVSTRGGTSIDGKPRDLKRGATMPDWWTDLNSLQTWSSERTGYPTQKPIKLLQRIINASSNQGDVILDPFCGCATTCVAAEVESRQWIGIDVSEMAFRLVQSRLEATLPAMDWKVIHREDIPTDRAGKRSKDIKHTLYGKQEGKCPGCLVWFPFRHMTVDHRIPSAKGGANTDDNLQLLCGNCNSRKGTRSMEELIVALEADGTRRRV